jgi:hypothetical protein
MDAQSSSETSVRTIATRRYIPEDGILHINRRERLKYYTDISLLNLCMEPSSGFMCRNIEVFEKLVRNEIFSSSLIQ